MVLEQEDDPRPVGAGIWLQHMGQQVLDRLGLLGALRAQSREVSRVDIRTSSGRQLVDASYADVPGSVPALGVHRGTLFSLLLSEARRRGIPLELGVPVTGVRPVPGGLAVETPSGDHGTYDLVVGCDGSQSRIRHSMNVATRDHAYDYGALWAIVDDPDELCADELYQCLHGTRHYLGVLPTGLGKASLFWSEPRLRDGQACSPAGCRPGGTPPGRSLDRWLPSWTASTGCCRRPTATSSCGRRTGSPAREPRCSPATPHTR